METGGSGKGVRNEAEATTGVAKMNGMGMERGGGAAVEDTGG